MVVAGILATKAAAEQLWLRWLARLVPWGGELALFCALWLHIPQAGGGLIQQYLRPFLHRHLRGLLALQARRDAAVGGVLRVAVFTRLLGERTAERLGGHVDELLLMVPAAVFTLSPMAAGWGLLFISLLYPAYATVRAMGGRPGGGSRSGGGGGGQSQQQSQQQPPPYPAEPWLRYWVVYALSHLLFQALPFWSVVQMWIFLWLLLPHLEGLPVLLDGRNLVFALLSLMYQEGGGGHSPRSKAADANKAGGAAEKKAPAAPVSPAVGEGKQQHDLRQRRPGSPKGTPPSSPKQQQQQQQQQRWQASHAGDKDS